MLSRSKQKKEIRLDSDLHSSNEEIQQDLYYYRIDDQRSRHYDIEADCSVGPTLHSLQLRQYKVLKFTNKGLWIDRYGSKKFILTKARRRFAHATYEEALEAYIKRRRRQASLLYAQLERSLKMLFLARHHQEKVQIFNAQDEKVASLKDPKMTPRNDVNDRFGYSFNFYQNLHELSQGFNKSLNTSLHDKKSPPVDGLTYEK
jgi:hypothetical protein